MKVTLPAVNSTPVGAGAQASFVAIIVIGILDSNLPWWHHQAPDVKTAATAVLTGAIGYLAGWLKVVLAKDQRVQLQLTPGFGPAVQNVPQPEPSPAPAPAPPAAPATSA